MIYVFGNSHSHFFTGSHPATHGFGENEHFLFKSFSLGPTLAYNFFENHYPRILSILQEIDFKKEQDYILLAVGEVDCRWHLPYQIYRQQRGEKEVIEECLIRFFQTFKDIQKRGIKCIAWSGHPSTTSGHNDDPSVPVFGNCVDRNRISKIWSDSLEKMSESEGIPFVSIIDELIDTNGLTNMSYFIDYCHLDTNKLSNILEKKFRDKNLWI